MIQQFSLSSMLDILDAPSTRHCYRYLLVDPLRSVNNYHSLSLARLRETLDKSAITPVRRTDLAYSVSHCPHLITLSQPYDFVNDVIAPLSLFEAENEIFLTKHYICSWLITELTPNDLAEKLVLIGDKLGKQINHYFYPYFEPMRLQLLQETLVLDVDNTWLRDEFSFVDYYYPSLKERQFNYLSQTGQLGGIPKRLTSKDDDTVVNNTPLTIDSIRYQQKFYLIQRLYLYWIQKQNNHDDNLLLRCANIVIESTRLGLTNEDDIIEFGYRSLQIETPLYQYEPCQKAVDAALKEPGSLTWHFNQLTETFWLSLQNLSDGE